MKELMKNFIFCAEVRFFRSAHSDVQNKAYFGENYFVFVCLPNVIYEVTTT